MSEDTSDSGSKEKNKGKERRLNGNAKNAHPKSKHHPVNFTKEDLVNIRLVDQTSDVKPIVIFFNAHAPPNKNGEAESIYKALPVIELEPLLNRDPIVTLSGPRDEAVQYYRSYAACQTISTYPLVTATRREGDPICDRTFVSLYDNRAIFALADGCNWGPRPLEAASKATASFVEYIENRQREIADIPEIGHFALLALCTAHEKIIEGKENIWDAGTTTFLGGMVMKLKENGPTNLPRYSMICASVGDCKAFHYSRATDIVTDVTELNRFMGDSLDQRDPGGRLGPYLDEGHPDLRNLALFHILASEGDLFVIVSDGVHDNLDPAMIGKMPNDISDSPAKDWKELPVYDSEKLRSRFRTQVLQKVIRAAKHHPAEISRLLSQHCLNCTQQARDYMEQKFRDNALGKKTPPMNIKFPGKMDHSTILCLKVINYGAHKHDEDDEEPIDYPDV